MLAVGPGPVRELAPAWALGLGLALGAIWVLAVGVSQFEDSEASREEPSPAWPLQNSQGGDTRGLGRRALTRGDIPHTESPGRGAGPLGVPSAAALGYASVVDGARAVDVVDLDRDERGSHAGTVEDTHNRARKGSVDRFRSS